MSAPLNLLKVEHIPQETETGCLPACVQMITRFLGRELAQAELSAIFQALPEGVPASRIKQLSAQGFHVTYAQNVELDTLREWIKQNIPPIVFLRTGNLPYWQMDTAHAVVVIGLTDEVIYLNDPAFPESPQVCALDAFLLAWAEFENRCARITL